jgi:hypothetical protein
MKEVNRLHLEWRRRHGGGGATQRDYLDFVIDGKSLSETIDDDFVSCLGWFVPEENAKAARRLLLESPSDFPDARQSLYVCPECGDLSCGAISAIIEADGESIIWRDFGYQNDYTAEVRFDEYRNIGPFAFDRLEYQGVIRGAAINNSIS